MDKLIAQLKNLIADYASGLLSKEEVIKNYQNLMTDYENIMGTEVPYLKCFKEQFEKIVEKQKFLKFIDSTLEIEQKRNILLRKTLGI